MVKVKKKPVKAPQKKFAKEAWTQESDKIPLPSKSDSLLKPLKMRVKKK